ncbi:hypothetical protein O181_025767 [Austropuccinia psidii MF-1]|uniref:GH26 domain-containing protein n=1 Tax=Austropuccinia psidii MF-1 TaxID=1389203 RepID=A0A9Q3CLV2_9BASI|nr:hypothetical protein [Austropuccinia psidii MF-1]
MVYSLVCSNRGKNKAKKYSYAHSKGLRSDCCHGGLNIGLRPSNLKVGGISVGFLPAEGQSEAPNTPSDINNVLGVPMAVVSRSIENVLRRQPRLSCASLLLGGKLCSAFRTRCKSIADRLALTRTFHSSEFLPSRRYQQLREYSRLKGSPVWEIALMPVEGLDKVTPETAVNIAKKMASLNAMGITVWLRFAHEMNGDWYNWGLKPDLFREKWKLVTATVRHFTTRTLMLWSPNSGFGKTHDSILGGYTPYWPGEGLVDIIGLSLYHYGGLQRLNVLPTPNEAQVIIKEFVNLFGARDHSRPMVLSETAASYTRSVRTGQPEMSRATEHDIKLAWLGQLLSQSMQNEVPELKAIVWFEVLKNENADYKSPVKSEDFRLLMGSNRALTQDAITLLTRHSTYPGTNKPLRTPLRRPHAENDSES